MGPHLVDQRAGGARVDQHAEHGQLAFGILVDQMGHHRKALVVDAFFGRMVEVKLHQIKGGAAHGQRVAPVQVDLYGVAVVHHAAVGRPVADL